MYAYYVLAGLLAVGACDDYLSEMVNGCSSKCDVTYDKSTECFNGTIGFFEKTLFGIMRNYVASQLNIASSSPNSVPPTQAQMISSTLNVMAQVKPANVEDEKNLMSVDDAKPIVEALVRNVKAADPGTYENVCPQDCQKSNSPWVWWFIGSCVVNFIFIAFGIFGMMQSHRKIGKSSKWITQAGVQAQKVDKQS
ncbi:unnamed protein product [Nippostrongylus brasiliensis]|uniref:Transmembrane protein n=1 Tax=Nippostrongylus brasiliensis TaxID=27835 RepID=A0A0N4YHF2_NIPBR|nr:unnamed protein product [Nippostrongylus brasiliensis]